MTTPIETGRRDKLITIQRAAKARGPTGDVTLIWSTIATRWAQWRTLTGFELAYTTQQIGTSTHVVTLPFVMGLTTEDRILAQGSPYQIDTLDDVSMAGVEHRAFVKQQV